MKSRSVRSRLRRVVHRTGIRVSVVGEILVHSDTPWYVRAVAVAVVAYAASPIDLIPDFIPILGYLDDMIVLPLGVLLVMKLTPSRIRHEAIRRALHSRRKSGRGRKWLGFSMVIVVWTAVLWLVVRAIVR